MPEQYISVDVTVFWVLLAASLLGVCGLFWAFVVWVARLLRVKW